MKAVRDIRGMSLIEVMTVVAILGVLVVVLGFSFQGWLEKYKVEDETKRFYADLSEARARALQKKRVIFVDLPTGDTKRYRTFEDTNTAPDGNGALEAAADTAVANTATTYSILPALQEGGVAVTRFRFDREGLASAAGTIRLVTAGMSPDYDCITVQPTRIRIGRFDGATCQEQ